MSNPSITADKTPWYQWDTGLTVTVSGGAMTECHFANRKQGTAYVQAVINGVARVPDELLQVAAQIKAYGYVSDGACGQTYVEQTFEVIARNIPADYTYTKTAQKTIRDAENARDEAVKASKDAKASELAADDSAVEASNSAQSAGESASAAATSASNSAKSAGEAAKSASDAKAAASKTVEDASALLKSYTDNAKTSADNASTSASNAADSASAASGSASAAEQSATDASNAKVAAQTAKAEAETAKSEAATSASNAAESATAAAKSASDAAASVGAINVIAPKTVATAAEKSGNSLAIGDGAIASPGAGGDYSMAIGAKSNAHGNESVAVGRLTYTEGLCSVAIGDCAQANGMGSIAIEDAYAIGNNSLALGRNSATNAKQSVAVGTGAVVNGGTAPDPNIKDYSPRVMNSVAIGSFSVVDEPRCVSVGNEVEGVDVYRRVLDSSQRYSETAPFWQIYHMPFPKSASHLKRRIINVAEPIKGHDAATKDYVDSNTSNALVGNVSGKLLHVEDAWPGKQLGLTIDGAYKQDGTPSPENPVPITVIENPVLKVTGRNLQPYPFAIHHEKVETVNGVTFTDNGDGSVTASGTAEEITFYNLDFTTDVKFLRDVKVTASMSNDIIFNVECFAADGSIKLITGNRNAPASFPSDAQTLRNYIYLNSGETVNATVYPQFEFGTKATAYKPYAGTFLPITLPAEHPYLAAIPYETPDEIVIDKDGNASLVAHVQKVDVSNLPAPDEVTPLDSGMTRYKYTGVIDTLAKQESHILAPSFENVVNYLFPKQGMYVSRFSIFVGATADPTDALKAGGYIYTTLATPVTYQLGKLDIPSLPETISNVWTDAELTTNMSMTYKRDINVAFNNLTQAVVAAAAGQ